MNIDLQEISTLIKNKLGDYSFDGSVITSDEGIVLESADGIARIGGLPSAMLGEMIEFPNQKFGIVLNLEFDEVVVIILGKHTDVKEGSWARCTNRIMQVPVGKNLLGRVVNAIGDPIDGLGPINSDTFRPIENVVPGVIDRAPVDTPLQTGYKIIDALVPIGRGQRELIVGDRQTGKTTIAVDTIINQKDTGVISIYVAIGQKSSAIVDVVNILKAANAFDNTIVIDASANDPAAMQYLAPFSGVAIAEEFMYTYHKDVLIIYDDLTKHANAYRTLSLLLQRPPGREAYPGDIFYLHSRLLERAAKLNDKWGGGSITALPIIETQKGDISTYIPTNVISITDGQIFLQTDLFYSGFKPAINAGISVSRVGGKAQIKAMQQLSGKLRLELARYKEKESFASFSSELDAATAKQLKSGRILTEILKQDKHAPLPVEKQIISIFLVAGECLIDINIEDTKDVEEFVLNSIEKEYPEILEIIRIEKKLSEEFKTNLKNIIQSIVAKFQSEKTKVL